MLDIAESKGFLKKSFHELLIPNQMSKLEGQFYDATVNVGKYVLLSIVYQMPQIADSSLVPEYNGVVSWHSLICKKLNKK